MVKKLLFFILAISLLFDVFGQWELIKEIDLPKNPTSYAKDSQENVYVAFQDGSLVKYGPGGNELLNYSLFNQSQITLIEPQFQLRTFLFYFDNQVITILDRFNSVPKNYPVHDFTNGIVSMACPAPDGTYWIVENNPLVLKRIDVNRKNLLLETQPRLGRDIRFMKAYQNILLILDEAGLHIFDQFGSLLHQIDVESNHFSIDNEFVYLLSKNEEITIAPFNGKIVSKSKIPTSQPDGVICSSNGCVVFKGNTMILLQKTN